MQASYNNFTDAPSEVSITGDPKDFTVVEGKLLTLHCSSNSQPPSVKEWYFDSEFV